MSAAAVLAMKRKNPPRVTRTLRLEDSLWTQLNRRSAEASLAAGRRVSVNALIRSALVEHFGLEVQAAHIDGVPPVRTARRRR